MKLFEIVQEYQALKDILENDCEYDDLTGEVTDNSLVIQELFNSLVLSLQSKLDNSAYVVKNLEGTADILKAEAKRLTQRAKSLENNADSLKGLMLNALTQAGGKLKTDLFTFSTHKSESVDIVCDVESLDIDFVRVNIVADKVAIKSALKNGLIVDGACLVENTSLQIK